MHVKKLDKSFIPAHPTDYGAMIAMTGKDFAIIGVDTDISTPDKNAKTSHKQRQNKIFLLSEQTVFASTGCTCYTLPFVQTARSYLADALEINYDDDTRCEKTVEIVGSMTLGRGHRFPYIHNLLITFNDKCPNLTAYSSTCCVARNTNYFIAGYVNQYCQDIVAATERCNCDSNAAISFITNCFTCAAKELACCKNTLHVASISPCGVRIIETNLL